MSDSKMVERHWVPNHGSGMSMFVSDSDAAKLEAVVRAGDAMRSYVRQIELLAYPMSSDAEDDHEIVAAYDAARREVGK